MDQPLVGIGRVAKAHGIRGEVVVDVHTDLPGRFDVGRTVVVGGERRTITASRPHQGRLLVQFAGTADRNAAELLRGRLVEAEARSVEDSDHYFVHELVGMRVVLDDRDLGVVQALIELPAAAGYDLLEVLGEDGETWLLPAADEHVEVEEVAGAARRLRLVDPPDGLVPDGLVPDGGEAVDPRDPDDEPT